MSPHSRASLKCVAGIYKRPSCPPRTPVFSGIDFKTPPPPLRVSARLNLAQRKRPSRRRLGQSVAACPLGRCPYGDRGLPCTWPLEAALPLSHGLVALTVTFRVLEGCGWPGPQGLPCAWGRWGSPPRLPRRRQAVLAGVSGVWPGPRCPGTLFVFKLDIKLSCETIRLEKPKECARALGVCLQRGPQQTLALLQVLWDQSKRCPSPAELSPPALSLR